VDIAMVPRAKTRNIFDNVRAAVCQWNDVVHLGVRHPLWGFEGRVRAIVDFTSMPGALAGDGDNEGVTVVVGCGQSPSSRSARPLSTLLAVLGD
jgi:hypothetical protein